MLKPFTRITFFATEAEFNQLHLFSTNITKGLLTVTPNAIFFESEGGFAENIPTREVQSAELAIEPIHPWYWPLVFSTPLLLSIMFVLDYVIPGKGTTENYILFPLAMLLVLGFGYATICKRTWVRITTNYGVVFYVSFMWQTRMVNLIINRQRDIWSWWLNRGDCIELAKRLNQNNKTKYILK